MSFPSAAEIAWMAALFEGEGYVAKPISSKDRACGSSSGLRIKFKMCDRDVLERFLRYAGGGHLSGPLKPTGLGKKTTYELIVNGVRAYALLVAFWPWLGMRRRGQVTIALQKWATMVPTSAGVKLTREDAADIRKELANGGHGIGRAMARKYSVTSGMITNIKKERAWATR